MIGDYTKKKKNLLNFCPISNNKGKAIGKAIEDFLLEWAIEDFLLEWAIDKVFTVTVDNAGSKDWGICILGGKHIHVRYVAHIINRVVNDGLKEMDSSICHVR
ncbi:hypothetical protein ACH5RR_037551 [Cinchona calisaya]|uniref:Transposase n=1 Tax=Cinchona calisaya TaxID=153742 RepID=A0ABD2YB83_9GENT